MFDTDNSGVSCAGYDCSGDPSKSCGKVERGCKCDLLEARKSTYKKIIEAKGEDGYQTALRECANEGHDFVCTMAYRLHNKSDTTHDKSTFVCIRCGYVLLRFLTWKEDWVMKRYVKALKGMRKCKFTSWM